VFNRIHCSFVWFIREFSRFIGKIGRYSSVEDFTIHIFNQMNFSQFFQKPIKLEGPIFLMSAGFLNTAQVLVACPSCACALDCSLVKKLSKHEYQ
jgi:hypothetical protein